MLSLGNYYAVEVKAEGVNPGEFNMDIFNNALDKALKDFAWENMDSYGRLVEYFDILKDLTDDKIATAYSQLALI